MRVLHRKAPRLLGSAVRTYHIEETASHVRAAGFEELDATSGSRNRPDGRSLSCHILYTADNMNNLLPLFFVKWEAPWPRPSVDAPVGCEFTVLEIWAANEDEMKHRVDILGLNTPIAIAWPPQPRVGISGPEGTLELTSPEGASES